MSETPAAPLSATHVVEYTYRRSLGPVLERFFTALREGSLLGIRAADGRVLVPPREYDPKTGTGLDELVEVADRGRVESWCWVRAPREAQPLAHPFAYALIRLDGADTPLLHVVDAGIPERMARGLRVRARWRPERTGSILDIAAFEPEDQGEAAR